MRNLLPLLLPSLAFAQTPAVGDLFLKIPPNVNALCVHRPDGTTVACSSGVATDWWVSGTLTADLGWVTASLGPNGYDLVRFASDGTLLGSTYLPHVGNFDEVVTTSDGRIVIADAYTQSLHFVSADGAPLASWALNGTFAPNRLVIEPDDSLWVFDSLNGKARHYDTSGILVGTFNTGVGTSDVARTSAGTFWLFEIGSSELRHMDANGNLLAEVTYLHGTIPAALTVDLDDNLWVAEWNSNEVDHLDPSGALLGSFDALGPPFHMQVIGPGGPLGTNYCGPANLNSSGQAGVISASGRPFVHLEQVHLSAVQLPPHQFGYFVGSQTQGFVIPPGSQGNLCLGGSLVRFVEGLASTGSTGSLQDDLDPDGAPGFAQPGETWHYQAWFRDQNPGATSNFTNGLTITYE